MSPIAKTEVLPKMFVRTVIVGLGAVVLFSMVGCFAKRPPAILAPKINPKAAGAQAMEMYDTSKDGKLDAAEAERCPALKDAFKRIDTTGEGTITAAKIAARIKVWQASRTGRKPVLFHIKWQGQPLAGAEVKLIPEKFLGGKMPEAVGTTDKNGVTLPTPPTDGLDDPPGVPPGFYRVEITKPGLNIPGRYNGASTLGLEVASDINSMTINNKFDLQPDRP